MAPLLRDLAPLQVAYARACLALDAFRKLELSDKNRSLLVKRKNRVLKPDGTLPIKQMVMEILKINPSGLMALQILESIKEDYSVEIMRTSLSPQLSRLKRAGEIQVRGKIWSILKDKPSDESEGLNNAGEGWNQSGSPESRPAGSIPVSSTPNSGTNTSSSSDVSSTHANEHTDRKE